jgi:hypothetical protein
VLEQTLGLAAMNARSASTVSQSPAPPEQKYIPKEQQYVDRIEAYLRRNKVEQAYTYFKRVQRPIRRYMGRKEFRKLKDRVERAHEYRKGK